MLKRGLIFSLLLLHLFLFEKNLHSQEIKTERNEKISNLKNGLEISLSRENLYIDKLEEIINIKVFPIKNPIKEGAITPFGEVMLYKNNYSIDVAPLGYRIYEIIGSFNRGNGISPYSRTILIVSPLKAFPPILIGLHFSGNLIESIKKSYKREREKISIETYLNGNDFVVQLN